MYEVNTRRSPLSVRNGPGKGFRLVTLLQKGEVVNVEKTLEMGPGNVWHRVARGWASARYLTRVLPGRSPGSGQTRGQSLPGFLSFNPGPPRNPRIADLERQLDDLNEQLEDAENRAYVNGQMAAMEGSRLYDLDPESERAKKWEEYVDLVAIPFGGGGAPPAGGIGIARNTRSMRMEEFEARARHDEHTIMMCELRIASIERKLASLR